MPNGEKGCDPEKPQGPSLNTPHLLKHDGAFQTVKWHRRHVCEAEYLEEEDPLLRGLPWGGLLFVLLKLGQDVRHQCTLWDHLGHVP